MKNEHEHGQERSMKVVKEILKNIRKGLLTVRSIELIKEISGDGWRVTMFLREHEAKRSN